jgi:hypothetical protein
MPGVGWPWDAQTRRLRRLLSRPTPCRPTPTAITLALPFTVQLGVEGTMRKRRPGSTRPGPAASGGANLYARCPHVVIGSWSLRGLEVALLIYLNRLMRDAAYELRRIHLPRTRVNKGRKKGRSPSVGPGPSRHADFFSGLRTHLSPRARLRSAQLRHCCRHGDSAILRGVNESGRLWHSALKSNDLPGSLLPMHSQRGA